jgi:hypothetical protein
MDTMGKHPLASHRGSASAVNRMPAMDLRVAIGWFRGRSRSLYSSPQSHACHPRVPSMSSTQTGLVHRTTPPSRRRQSACATSEHSIATSEHSISMIRG